MLKSGWTCLMLIVFLTFVSMPARAMTVLHFLVKADSPENAATIADKIPSLPMTNCKPGRPVSIAPGEIVFVLPCSELDRDRKSMIEDISMIWQIEHVKSVILFAV
jgi:hypothetical protein